MSDDLMTLAEAAEKLGVHYMTAYRYVRTGRLAASKRVGQWWISAADLDEVLNNNSAATTSPAAPTEVKPSFLAQAPRRLLARSIAGDEVGAWAIIGEALAYGASPADVHLKITGPMLRDLGADWRLGLITTAQEHLASVVVARLIGRLGPQFSPRGRRRASVVLGAVEGEHHGLAVMMLADLLVGGGFNVRNLGPNTPAEAFVETCRSVDGDLAVGLSAIGDSSRDELSSCVRTLRAEIPSVPIFVGGPVGCELAPSLDVTGSAQTGGDALAMFEAHFPRPRVHPAT